MPSLPGRNEQRQPIPVPAAPKSTLLRRLADLIGLPPTRKSCRHSSQMIRPRRTRKSSIDSPESAVRERWGRHWMTSGRYSDGTDGGMFPTWNSSAALAMAGLDRPLAERRSRLRPHAARDAGGRRSVPGRRRGGVAVRYLIRNCMRSTLNDWMRSTVEHTGKAFLG
jgi:hypothetical protein